MSRVRHIKIGVFNFLCQIFFGSHSQLKATVQWSPLRTAPKIHAQSKTKTNLHIRYFCGILCHLKWNGTMLVAIWSANIDTNTTVIHTYQTNSVVFHYVRTHTIHVIILEFLFSFLIHFTCVCLSWPVPYHIFFSSLRCHHFSMILFWISHSLHW